MGESRKAVDRMMQLQAITEVEAHTILARELTGSEACDRIAEDCALLRSCAWALTDGVHPVHILRLLNLASTLHLAGDASRGKLKEALQALSECGDLAELSNGQWLPALTREVRLGTADDMRLLVGGFPTSLLTAERAAQIEHIGPYRRVRGDALSKELELPQQSLVAWMGHAPDDLREWTQSALPNNYERHRPTGQSIEIYAPELSAASTPQMFRWVDRLDKLSGIYLSREELPFGGKRHYAVKIAKGQISGIRTMPPIDLRRLMYGLDLLAEKPVIVEEVSGLADTSFVLKSVLPQAEQRLFAALGQWAVPEGKYYPQTWTFHQEHAGDIKKRLATLGISTFVRTHR
jgi:hypothetical protein